MLSERTKPRLIPVLDVMNGQVVRAIGGQRDAYRPVVSKLTTSTDPVEVARTLLEAAHAEELYVADLDAIRGHREVSPTVQAVTSALGSVSWVDVGAEHQKAVEDLLATSFTYPVIALETAPDPELLAWSASIHYTSVAFSLDLHRGVLLGNWKNWGAKHNRDAISVAHTAVGAGAKALIILDLARVGTETGVGTEPLLRAIRDEFPGVDLIAGGGVRSWEDVERLGKAGATGVLVASALHDGMLG